MPPAAPANARPPDLGRLLPRSALVYRGYNTSNLGRTPELLATPAYQQVMIRRLDEVSAIASDQLGRSIDLVEQVRQQREYGLEDYAREVALIYAVELAQLDLLREVHGLTVDGAQLAWGYSLGEVVALAASGATRIDEAIRAPLAMAADCAELAADVTMGVVFSRKMALSEVETHRLCSQITAERKGAIAVSSILSPNTFLVLGQGGAIDRFAEEMSALSPSRVYLRKNDHRWPPLHTPIVRQRCVPDRASVMIEGTQGDATLARPPVFSLVTGTMAASEPNLHELLRDWVDRPQRLWDAVCATLASGARCVLHIGPAPNLAPATFNRLAENINAQSAAGPVSSLSMRALRQIAKRPWLASILPQRASLLRVTELEQVIVEDWLLDNAP